MVKAVPRGFTTVADASLTPVIKKYLRSFAAGFDSGLDDVQVFCRIVIDTLTKPVSSRPGSPLPIDAPRTTGGKDLNIKAHINGVIVRFCSCSRMVV